MRTFLVLCLIGTLGIVGSSAEADAAGIPPTIEFTFSCQDSGTAGLLEWTATNNDLGAHDLVAVLQPNNVSFPEPMAAGVAFVDGGAGSSVGITTGFDIFEDGVLLASSGLQVVDLAEPDCWGDPLDMVPVPLAPSVDIGFECGILGNVAVTVTVTNNDGLGHDLFVIDVASGSTDEQPLTLVAGDDVETASFLAIFGSAHRFLVGEDADILADTGFVYVGGVGEDEDCFSPVPAAAPTASFGTHCDDGGAVVDIHLVNHDLQVHDVDAFIEIEGVIEEIPVQDLDNEEPDIEVHKFVPFGTTFQVTVKEADVVLGVSPLWQGLADDGFCAVEPDPGLPIVPIGDVPLDQPTTTTVPEPEPEPGATTTTTAPPVTVPEVDEGGSFGAEHVDAAVLSESVRSFVPVGPAVVPEVGPAREALARTGVSVNRTLGLAWLLIGAGFVVKLAAVKRQRRTT